VFKSWLVIPILSAALTGGLIGAEDFAGYRGLQFGMSLDAAAKQTGARLADAKVLHQRPAVIQELEWQLDPPALDDRTKADPVKNVLMSFFNGELFRMVVTYDRHRVEGMTPEDMIGGISATYGTATRPSVQISYRSDYAEVAPLIARWENPEYSYNLVRTGDHSSFAMILYSKRLDALAQAAITEAIRLDQQEAPKREMAEREKQAEAERQVLDAARSANKPNFRP
jgi:hypothetical protein